MAIDVDAKPEEFIQWIGQALRADTEKITDEKFKFTIPENIEKEINIREIEYVLQKLSTKDEYEDTTIYDNQSYEILVREESRFSQFVYRIFRRYEEPYLLTDNENNLTYQVYYPSDEYMLFLLYKLSKLDKTFYRSIGRRGILPIPNNASEIKDMSILDLLKFQSRRLMSLRIISGRSKTLKDFEKYANSFVFHLTYNLEEVIVPQRFLDTFLIPGRIRRLRRTRIDEVDAPKQFYHSDLVYHYQSGIASENPSLEYLSYYHVAEHFFEAVFHDELNEKIKRRIAHPGFSIKRKKDISDLVKDISSSLQFQKENITINELEALKLTLMRYINPTVLSVEIRGYDVSLIDYYKNSTVDFSNGDIVDLENIDANQIFSQLSKRIYKTRNAIVHSKESDKGKYIPFDHDKILIKEIPLMRFCAELIIMSSATFIE